MRLYARALMLIRLVYLLIVRMPGWLVQVLRPGGIRRGSARALIAQAGGRVPEFRSLAVADNLRAHATSIPRRLRNENLSCFPQQPLRRPRRHR